MTDHKLWEAPKRIFKWSDLQRLVSLVRTQGIGGAFTEARTATLYRLAAFEGRRFDQAHSVETNELVLVPEYGGAGPSYTPSLTSLLRIALRQLPPDLSDHVFVDVGSGKGRVLLVAAERKFKRILGVELTQELHEQAQRNIVNFRGPRQTQEIHSVLSDAREFEIPQEPCVLYIFGAVAVYAELFETFVRNVERSYSQAPRGIFLITFNVEATEVMQRSLVFTELAVRGVLTSVVLGQLGSVRIFATREAHGR